MGSEMCIRDSNRAMGVYAAMSGAGAAIGVLLGGILTDALSWRWVLFVNVPIGIFVLLLAPRVLGETEAQPGRLDLPGALSATAGMTLLVYGLIHASGASGWRSPGTVVPLVLGGLLLVTFVFIESRSKHALMPLDIFSNRNRNGAYAIMLAIGTAMFSMFFFLTLFLQNVLGFSALRAGVAYLPFAVIIMVVAGAAAKLVGRVGPRFPLMLGTFLAAGGLFWFSRLTPDSTYATGVLPGMVLGASGMALTFVPLTLLAVSGVRRDETGIASALLNSGQQVGGSLGLAILGTIAASVTRSDLVNAFGSSAAQRITNGTAATAAHSPAVVRHTVSTAYTNGFTAAFEVGAIILLFAFVISVVVVRTGREPVGEMAIEPAV